MTVCPHSFLALLFLALSGTFATATPPNLPTQQHLRRAVVSPAAASVKDKSVSERRQRRLDESDEVATPAVQGTNEEVTVHESSEGDSVTQSASGDDESNNQDKRESTSIDEAADDHATPSATLAEREAEDPLLAEEDTASTILLDLSLSLTAQRFLGLMAAIAGMIFTAYSMSENPDGLYASLCRSILTGFRVLCRVVTCKACFFGDGRSRAAHRHIPIDSFDTWSVNIE